MIAVTLSRGGGPLASGSSSACCSSPREVGGCGRNAAAEAPAPRRPAMPKWELETPPGAEARARLARAVRDRPGVHRGLGLLLARAGRPGARSASPGSCTWSPPSSSGSSSLSYVEGASLHQERGGATIIARYAFNELWSFIAGWAILLDYILLIALTAFATTDYVAVLFGAAAGGLAGVPVRRRRRRRRRVAEHPRRRLRRYERFASSCSPTSCCRRRSSCSGWRCCSTPTRSPTRPASAGTPSTSDLSSPSRSRS